MSIFLPSHSSDLRLLVTPALFCMIVSFVIVLIYISPFYFLFICLSVSLFRLSLLLLCACLSMYLSVYLFTYLFVRLSMYVSVYTSIYLYINSPPPFSLTHANKLSLSLSHFLPPSLSPLIHLSLYVFLSACLSVCLSVSASSPSPLSFSPCLKIARVNSRRNTGCFQKIRTHSPSPFVLSRLFFVLLFLLLIRIWMSSLCLPTRRR